MDKPFKVRPVSGKVKDGPFRALVSDQDLAHFGARNQSPAWVIGKTHIQVLLWREVPFKGQQSQTSAGQVILLSDVVRQLAGLSLGDEIRIIPDGDAPAKATELKVTSSPSTQLEITSQISKAIQDALLESSFIMCGQEIEAAGHAWKIHEVNHSLVGGLYSVSNETKVEIALNESHEGLSKIKRDGIHGLDKVLDSLDYIWTGYRPGVSEYLVDDSPGLTTVLLTGQSEVGKTMVLDAVARLAWPKVFRLEVSSLTVENTIRDVFNRASMFDRSLIITDKLNDCFGPEPKGNKRAEILYQMLAKLRPNAKSRTLFMATAPSVDQVDSILFKSDGFECVHRLGLPGLRARELILRDHLGEKFCDLSESPAVVKEMAERTPAFSPGDLRMLGRRTQFHMGAVRASGVSDISDILLESVKLAFGDVHPKTMEGLHVEVPTTRFADIGGQAELKQFLKDNVQHSLSETTKRGGVRSRPAKGLLMYGPPGCSKTLFARAVATEFGLNFVLVDPGALINSYVGESEKQIREVFRRARDAAPCVIFFDEFETLGGDRNSGLKGLNTTQTLLTEIDGVVSLEGVFILAATNRPQSIDSALLRKGRLRPFMVGPPDEAGRREILNIKLSELEAPFVGHIDHGSIVEQTAGCTGAEVTDFVEMAIESAEKDAKLTAQNERLEQRHFEAVKGRLKRSVNEETLRQFQAWGNEVRF